MVLEEPGEVCGRRADLHEVEARSRGRGARPSNRRRAHRRPSARTALPARTPPPARRGGRPARTSRRAPSRRRGRRRPRGRPRARAPRRARARASRGATSRDSPSAPGRGRRGEQVEPERAREEPRGELSLDAVPRRVEPRREGAEPALARGDGHDAAADAALPGQPDVVQPVAGGLVEAGRRHHRERVAAGLLGDDPLAGQRVDAAVRERRPHHGEVARGHARGSTAACRGRPPPRGRSRGGRGARARPRARGSGGSSRRRRRTPPRRARADGPRTRESPSCDECPALLARRARARGSSSRSRRG